MDFLSTDVDMLALDWIKLHSPGGFLFPQGADIILQLGSIIGGGVLDIPGDY